MILFFNYVLLFLGTLALVTGIYYYIFERNHSTVNMIIYFLGIFTFLWCMGYSLVGFSQGYSFAFVGRLIGFIGIVGFLIGEYLLLVMATNRFNTKHKVITALMLLLATIDGFIYLDPRYVEFVRKDFITVIRQLPNPAKYIHLVFIVLVCFCLYKYAFTWMKQSNFKRENRIMITLIIVNSLIIVGAIPDLLFPFIGIDVVPTSGFFAFIAYISLVVSCLKFNAFSISEANLNSYIFNYAHSPIMIFDTNQNLVMLNHFGRDFLKVKRISGQKLSDLFDISTTDAEKLLGSLSPECLSKTVRLVTKQDHTICILTLSCVLDFYKEPYCTVCFSYDLSKETSMLRELDSMKSQLETALEEKQLEIDNLTLQAITTIANTIDAKDAYTKGHSLRVAQYSAILAQSLGWSDEEVRNLRYTALLHDIGKIGIPDVILNKPGKLSDAEFSMIQSHTTTGGDILKDILMIPDVSAGAMYHHERFDGQGYPKGLKGEEIPVVARIICIADAYDAMNSNRVYRNALFTPNICDELNKGRGTQFDPQLLDHFLSLLQNGSLQLPSMDNSGSFISPSEELSLATETTSLLVKLVHNLDRENQNKSNIDYLTGLIGRYDGEKRIQEAIRQSPGCLAFIDLDNLKHINDTVGHSTGDAALKMLSDILKEYSHSAIISRIGGDEFLFYLPDCTKEVAEEIVSGIITTFISRRDSNTLLHSASISIGLCLCNPSDTFTDVFQKADKALYHVKQNGKNNYYFYPDDNLEIKHISSVDLMELKKNMSKYGNYSGAMKSEYREFIKMFGFLMNISNRFDHGMQLIMITLDGSEAEDYTAEEQEKAMLALENIIGSSLRTIDIYTRFSNSQFLILLLNAKEDSLDLIIHRIFEAFLKQYPRKDLILSYDL